MLRRSEKQDLYQTCTARNKEKFVVKQDLIYCLISNFQLILSFLKKESPFWLHMTSGETGLMKKVFGNISQLNLILLS